MERSYPVVFLALFAVVTIAALLVAGSVSGTAFNTYNPAWDGTSELRSLGDDTGARIDIVQETAYYQTTDPQGTVVFILSPDSAYTPDEVTAIQEFVAEGGTLVVAGDFDRETNQLLADLGVESRLDGARVRDERNYERSPALPHARNTTAHPYTADVDQLTLNHATVLRFTDTSANTTLTNADVNATTRTGANGTIRLVNTTSFAYLDTNGNDELDDNETLQTYTVVSIEQVGRGDVITVSDPSLFINAMLDQGDNRRFAANILTAHDRVGVDVSHTSELPPVAWTVVTIRNAPLVQLIGGVTLVLVVTRWRRVVAAGETLLDRLTDPESEPPAVSQDALLESLEKRYPEWDDQRVRRVAQTLIHREEKSQADE